MGQKTRKDMMLNDGLLQAIKDDERYGVKPELNNKIYQAIRKTYGYTDEADELIDYVMDMTDSFEALGRRNNE